MRVSSRSLVFTLSTSPLLRSWSMLMWMASWWGVMRRDRSTNAGMRQRRAHEIHRCRACLAACLAPWRARVNTTRSPSFSAPRPVHPRMRLGQPVQLGLLRLGQVLGVAPQRPAGLLQRLGLLRGLPFAAAGGVPGIAADLVECLGGPLHDV